MSSKEFIQELLKKTDIEIGGGRSWDIEIHEEKFYDRVMKGGTLALGESYMDGWWDVKDLDEFFNKVLSAQLEKKIRPTLGILLTYAKSRLFNIPKLRAFAIGEHHYDIGNDLYEAMLDKRLTYTCGYWKEAQTLDDAQEAKLDLVCRKIGLKKGERVLDIGSGWGSFIHFAAEKYGALCTGLTVSKEQAEYANAKKGSLPIETRLQDYHDVTEHFSHVVSLGMFEHVGYKNYRAYMKKVHSVLNDGGLFLLHTIGSAKSVHTTEAWIAKYIFPDSMLPSMAQISKSVEGLFVIEDFHNFGAYYDTTLMHWFKNFDANWPRLKDKYGERFYRMWKYYLLASAGSFRARKNQLWQIVLSKKGVRGGYAPVR
ncbi:MAG: cyclopropane fatty acyl phospholipid synthase [Patescibacteria group bacterium]